MTAVVSLSGASRCYATPSEVVTAVENVTMQLESGNLTALVGPSGSGKTTLINLIVGWDVPDEGEVARRPDMGDDWESIAIVPQGLGLLPELTLSENIQLPASLGNRTTVDVEELAGLLGLADVLDHLPDAVSLGEQQRAAIARALSPGAKLLVADEPTTHQDEDRALLIASLLGRAAATGSAVLLATHDPRLLAHADTVFELVDGRLSSA